MSLLESLLSLNELGDGIVMADVSIPSLITNLLPGVASAKRGVPGVDLTRFSGLFAFFREDEIQRACEFKVLKKQAEWLSGRLAVKQAAAFFLGCEAKGVRIKTHEEGAPYLADYPDHPISITHSGDHAVALFSAVKGRQVAVDMEWVEPGRMPHVARVAFTQREIDEMKGHPDEEWYRRWTLKEAFLKYIGKGFHENLKRVEILNCGICHHGEVVEGIVSQSPSFHPGYCISMIWTRG